MAARQSPAAEAVVLFDIDGTLLRRSGPHHRQALVEAIRRVTGLDSTTDHIPLQGMLDRDILAAMLRAAGAPASLARRAMPDLIRHAQSYYIRNSPPDLRRKVCPGARRLLQALRSRAVPMGLVTGNLTRIGWRKMERADLKPFFRFGAFAELARTRAGLVRIALRKARQEGWAGRGTRLWLVGDHPNDVLAARANGIRSVSVATGVCGADELSACAPDILVEDLRSLEVEMLFEA